MALKIDQYLTFNDGTQWAATKDLYALFPPSLNGQYVEFTLYVEFDSSANAGKVQIESSYAPTEQPYTGTWAAQGSTIDYAAASSQKSASVTGTFKQLRARIDTAVGGGGKVRLGLVASN